MTLTVAQPIPSGLPAKLIPLVAGLHSSPLTKKPSTTSAPLSAPRQATTTPSGNNDENTNFSNRYHTLIASAPAGFSPSHANKKSFPILESVTISLKNLQQDNVWAWWLAGGSASAFIVLAVLLPNTRIESILASQAHTAYSNGNIRQASHYIRMLLEKSAGQRLPFSTQDLSYFDAEQFNRSNARNKAIQNALSWLRLEGMDNTDGISQQTKDSIARMLSNSVHLSQHGATAVSRIPLEQAREYIPVLYSALPDTDINELMLKAFRDCNPSEQSLLNLLYFHANIRRFPEKSNQDVIHSFLRRDLILTFVKDLPLNKANSGDNLSFGEANCLANANYVKAALAKRMEHATHNQRRLRPLAKVLLKNPLENQISLARGGTSLAILDTLIREYTFNKTRLPSLDVSAFFLRDRRLCDLLLTLLDISHLMHGNDILNRTPLSSKAHPLYQHPWFKDAFLHTATEPLATPLAEAPPETILTLLNHLQSELKKSLTPFTQPTLVGVQTKISPILHECLRLTEAKQHFPLSFEN
jgi:hypothetical protein